VDGGRVGSESGVDGEVVEACLTRVEGEEGERAWPGAYLVVFFVHCVDEAVCISVLLMEGLLEF